MRASEQSHRPEKPTERRAHGGEALGFLRVQRAAFEVHPAHRDDERQYRPGFVENHCRQLLFL